MGHDSKNIKALHGWLIGNTSKRRQWDVYNNQLYLSVSEKRAIISNNSIVPVAVQSLSPVWLLATPWTAARQASLTFIISQSLLTSCPLRLWCHPTISSLLSPFSSCPQFFPASGSFPRSRLFASGDQSIVASALASVLTMNNNFILY